MNDGYMIDIINTILVYSEVIPIDNHIILDELNEINDYIVLN